MTQYEELTLQLRICELSMQQVHLELAYGGHLHMEAEAVLEATQDNIILLGDAIQEACKDAQTK